MRRLMMCVLLAACSGSENPTRGDGCTQLSEAWCQTASNCAGNWTAGDVATCRGTFVLQCCGGPPNTCEAEASRSQDQIDACDAALRNWSCSSIQAGTLPPICITG